MGFVGEGFHALKKVFVLRNARFIQPQSFCKQNKSSPYTGELFCIHSSESTKENVHNQKCPFVERQGCRPLQLVMHLKSFAPQRLLSRLVHLRCPSKNSNSSNHPSDTLYPLSGPDSYFVLSRASVLGA